MLDYVCANCGKQMYDNMLDGTHEENFCSVGCQDKWYTQQRRLNQPYDCKWCGEWISQSTYDQYFGCCSEGCLVSLEGAAYEEAEENGEVGGQTLCGWCEIPIYGDEAFCSESCEQAHHNYYN